MYICYLDESGNVEASDNSLHFVLAGISIPTWQWKACEREIKGVKSKYDLSNSEVHAAWLLRNYKQQEEINNFEALNYGERRIEVQKLRDEKIAILTRVEQELRSKGAVKAEVNKAKRKLQREKKTQQETKAFIHLTLEERRELIKQIAECISNWEFARLFAECIDKSHFEHREGSLPMNGQAFEQVVSRFHSYLRITEQSTPNYGLLVHDNSQKVAEKYTLMIREFNERKKTSWVEFTNIIETPFFVDSQLTSMVQIADLCAYSLRRYLDDRQKVDKHPIEVDLGKTLFGYIFSRADRKGGRVHGVRHFTKSSCDCCICTAKTPLYLPIER